MTGTTLDDRLQALVGKPIGEGGPNVAPDPVNEPMIRHWAAAFEDANPVYTDADAAARVAVRRDRGAAVDAADLDHGDAADHRHGRTGRIADRGRARPRCSTCSTRPASSARSRRTRSSRSSATCASVMSCRATTVLESVSPQKQTRIGPGYFVTWVTTYTVGDGEVVGPPALSHPEVPAGGRCVVSAPPRTVDDRRHAVLLGRRARASAARSSACTGAARSATRRGPCARRAARSSGTRSRRRGGAPCSAS